MALVLDGYERRVEEAVGSFWEAREKFGVRSGKTLDAFVDLIAWVVHSNGLPTAEIISGHDAQLPGFFRPTKSWDIVIVSGGTLVGAIELKSIADSFGNNANNRTEEALGSGVDIKEAFEEDAFDGLTRLFTGYLLLVEDCPKTHSFVKIRMKHFQAMRDFLANPADDFESYKKNDDGIYSPIDGVSYMNRFDILCRKLMQKKIYTAACVIKSSRQPDHYGEYSDVSKDTRIKAFLASLASHTQAVAAINN